MNRISLNQYLINKHNFKKYLEIGTQAGESFLPIKCRKKIAVDPKFYISAKKKYEWLKRNPSNWNNKYFEMTSDQFFLTQQKFLERIGGLDIVFIDGLHAFLATLKDSLNSIGYLNNEGVIVLHDCFPPHKAAAIPAANAAEAMEKGRELEGWTGEWCGDSWKAMVYLRQKYPKQLDVSVLNADYGLGIIKIVNKIKLDLVLDASLFQQIESLSFEDLVKDPENLIGLKSEDHYSIL